MKKRYQAVVFDLDGTLLDTLEDLMNSVNHGLTLMNMPERSLDEIRHFVGNGVQRLVELAVPQGTGQEEIDQVFSFFKEHYARHCNDKTDVYPGTLELLADLKKRGFQMAIVSNKLQEGVDALSRQYFAPYTKVAIGARDGIKKKPAPDTVLEALRLLGVAKEDAVYVGDSEVDIATAANVGMDCIMVAWGFRTREEQENAGGKVFVDAPEKILEYLYE